MPWTSHTISRSAVKTDYALLKVYLMDTLLEPHKYKWSTCISLIIQCQWYVVFFKTEAKILVKQYEIYFFIYWIYLRGKIIFLYISKMHFDIVFHLCRWLQAGLWFSLGTPVSSINETDRHDISKILLKVAVNTITSTLNSMSSIYDKNKLTVSCTNFNYYWESKVYG